MPGPVIYVVAVIGTVAAGLAFKEFIFDPHMRPRIDAWVENRRAQRQQRRQPVPVPQRPRSASTSSDDDDNLPLRDLQEKREKERSRDSVASSSPIELEMLVAREVDEWRSGVSMGSRTGLRSRHPSRPASASPNFMDDHDDAPTPQLPLAPVRSNRDILFDYQGSSSHDQPARSSPSPTATLSSVSEMSEDPFKDPQIALPQPHAPPALPVLHIASPLSQGAHPSPGLPTPLSLPPRASPRFGSTRASTPDTDLLASSMLTSAYLTPQGGPISLPPSHSGLSTPSPMASPAFSASSPQISVEVLSATGSSRPMSPFFDIGPSHPLSPLQMPEPRAVSEDEDMFSLPSHVSSDEDDFDLASLPGSETSSWADAHDDSNSARR